MLEESTTVPSADRLDLVAAVRLLPRRQREAIVLRYYFDLPVEDVARALRTSPGAVRNALHHARRALARRLADKAEPEDVRER